MRNYDIETETVELKIQRAKVLPKTHAGEAQSAELHPPFGQIKFSAGWRIPGQEIYMTGNLISASEARIKMKTKPGASKPQDLPI